MLGLSVEHSRIVADSISGARKIDEQSYESAAVLSDRLERLKSLGKAFCGVEFSSTVAQIAEQESKLAIS